MGNRGSRDKQGRKRVRVMLPEGNFLILPCPVVVSEVMVAYPNHMVVHCESPKGRNSRDDSGRSKITIMHPDQELQGGEDYILHLVPPQYRKVVYQTLSQPSPHVGVTKKQPKHRVLRMVSRAGLVAFFPRRDRGRHNQTQSSISSLLDSEAEPQVCVFMGWQPSLQGIPECSPEEEEQEEERGQQAPQQELVLKDPREDYFSSNEKFSYSEMELVAASVSTVGSRTLVSCIEEKTSEIGSREDIHILVCTDSAA
ncbi:hypothetical protein R1sor_016250 [Riccia sorocarpa]|uniref:RHD domain-containing protein n=1 Tax=Riccia sorocarpa TaxID=122646 RepID=A0ABD3HGA8_9MARC